MHPNPLAPSLDIVLQRTQRSGTGRRAILAGAAALVCAAALEPHRNVWAQASASAVNRGPKRKSRLPTMIPTGTPESDTPRNALATPAANGSRNWSSPIH